MSSGCATARGTTDTCVPSCESYVFNSISLILLWQSCAFTILGVEKAFWWVAFSGDAPVLLHDIVLNATRANAETLCAHCFKCMTWLTLINKYSLNKCDHTHWPMLYRGLWTAKVHVTATPKMKPMMIPYANPWHTAGLASVWTPCAATPFFAVDFRFLISFATRPVALNNLSIYKMRAIFQGFILKIRVLILGAFFRTNSWVANGNFAIDARCEVVQKSDQQSPN